MGYEYDDDYDSDRDRIWRYGESGTQVMSCHVGDAPLSCWSTAALRSTVVIFFLFRLRLVSN